MYGEDSIKAESSLSWHKIFPAVNIREFIDIKKTEIEAQDLAINFDDLTLFSKDNLFDFMPKSLITTGLSTE